VQLVARGAALAVNTTGGEQTELFVYDVPSDTRLTVVEEAAVGPIANVQWDPNGDALYYTRADEHLRTHVVGAQPVGGA